MVSPVVDQLLVECLAPSEDERRDLVSELLASIMARDPGWEEAWAAEAEERSRASDAAGDRGRPWADVMAVLAAKLAR
jgi:hypothetical protein